VSPKNVLVLYMIMFDVENSKLMPRRSSLIRTKS
jgi:hypothetical protein